MQVSRGTFKAFVSIGCQGTLIEGQTPSRDKKQSTTGKKGDWKRTALIGFAAKKYVI